MESDFEKNLQRVKPKGVTPDEKHMLWSNITESIKAEKFIRAHKKIYAGPFNMFLYAKKVRYTVAAILAGTLLTGSFATVALADNSRPGDFLFPVDLITETLRLRLTSPDNRDELQIQFASERLEEVKELLALANIDFEELVFAASEDATSTATTTDDTTATSTDDATDDTATSTDDTTDDTATSTDDATDDTATSTDDTATSTDDTSDEDSNNDEDTSESQPTYDYDALAQASNAFLIALNYLENSRNSLIADGNETAVMAIDAFIAELTFLADNHVGDIDRARFAVNNKNENQKVSIAIEASIDEVKTKFKFTEVIESDGDSKQKIAFSDGDGTLKLSADENNTVFEINNESNKDKDKDKYKRPSSKIDVCYKNKDLELHHNDLSKYLRKGASLGECHNHDDDGDDDGDDDDDGDKDGKVYVCHKDKNTLHISGYAKWAHLRHGDEPGKCGDADDDDDNDVVTVPDCSLAEDVDGRTIFSFGGSMVRSDSGQSSSYTNHHDVTLDEGLYKVTLMSYDGYIGREDDSQPNESWQIVFWDKSENEFQRTHAVSDIPDYVREETVIEVVDEAFEYNGEADDLYAQHSAYPDTSSPNSVKVICAAFDEVEDTSDNDAPVITDIQSEEGQSTANVSWTTDENATSKVWYSQNSGFPTSGSTDFVSSGTLKQSHLLTINGLTASTTYYFRVESSDASANKAVSNEGQFTTLSAPPPVDETPPIITGIAINPTTTSATAAWITNEPTTGIIWYSQISPVDIAGVSDAKESNSLNTSHAVDIENLSPETEYYYIVVATDESGNTSTSTEDSFETETLPEPPDETAPVVSALTKVATTTEATIEFSTDEDSTSTIWYSTISPVPIGAPSMSLGLTQSHSYTLTSLTPETTYYFLIEVEDESGNDAMESEDSFTTTAIPEPADTTAPEITDINADAGSTTAQVSFSTNEDATSVLYYSDSPSVDVGSSLSESVVTPTTTHVFNLSGLATSTTYYYLLTATDESSNTATSSEESFGTL